MACCLVAHLHFGLRVHRDLPLRPEVAWFHHDSHVPAGRLPTADPAAANSAAVIAAGSSGHHATAGVSDAGKGLV